MRSLRAYVLVGAVTWSIGLLAVWATTLTLHREALQSVVVDPVNRLWILDTAAPSFSTPVRGGAKLVAVDLATDNVAKTIVLPSSAVLPTTYINDVRFDLRQGKAGVAYITDSSVRGPGAIIVVDLDSGDSWRKLSGHPST